MNMKGRIVDISFKQHRSTYIMQGIKKHEQYKYDEYYPGGNGTYVTGGKYTSSIELKVYVYDLGKCMSFNIKNVVLKRNNRDKVSDKMINILCEKNKGKKITLNNLALCYNDLDLLLE